ncbi:hypothetical protein HK102_006407, partial [Quaeritorhiza haematococci]
MSAGGNRNRPSGAGGGVNDPYSYYSNTNPYAASASQQVPTYNTATSNPYSSSSAPPPANPYSTSAPANTPPYHHQQQQYHPHPQQQQQHVPQYYPSHSNQMVPGSSAASTVASTYASTFTTTTATTAAGTRKKSHYSLFGPYRLIRTIGEGEFGKVKLAFHTDTNREVAIKLIKKENIESLSRRSKLMREISILQSVDHPYIVKLLEVIETDQYIGMIMEYASGGELFEHILAHRYLKEREACRFFAQLISGVNYLHTHGIVHRDLKLENLLLDGSRNIIITDFGFANRSGNGTTGG